jgi:class 3 adenylate cyclase
MVYLSSGEQSGERDRKRSRRCGRQPLSYYMRPSPRRGVLHMVDDRNVYVRIDFVSETKILDEDKRIVQVTMRPDPRRYEQFTEGCEVKWRDKYMGFVFGREILEQAALQAPGTPVFYSPQKIASADEYVQDRKTALEVELISGNYQPLPQQPDRHRILQGNEKREMTFVSIDVCSSTMLQRQFGVKYQQVFKKMFREFGLIVSQFHGCIMKSTGDGMIAYVDMPSINTQCDLTIDMCLTVLRALDGIINKVVLPEGLPPIQIRIGAEHGVAEIYFLEIPDLTFVQHEVFSNALNTAVKLQEAAPANSLLIGDSLYQRLHVQWLERCTPANIESKNDLAALGFQAHLVS